MLPRAAFPHALLLALCFFAASAPSSKAAVSPWETLDATAAPSFWDYSGCGTNLGTSGLFKLDTTEGPELVVAANLDNFAGYNAQYWYVLRWDAATGTLVRTHVSPPQQTAGGFRTLVSLRAAQITGDATPEIVAAYQDGTVITYDATTFQVLSTVQLSDAHITALEVADLYNDGNAEFLVLDTTRFQVFSSTGQLLWSIANSSPYYWSMAVGHFEDGVGTEIALSSGVIVDATTHAIRWTRPTGSTSWNQLKAGDWDGDGRDELFVSGADSSGVAFAGVDVQHQTELFRRKVSGVSLYGFEISGQPGALTLITAGGSFPGLDVANGLAGYHLQPGDQSLIWNKPLSSQTGGVVSGDFNQDGHPDVFAPYVLPSASAGTYELLRTDTLEESHGDALLPGLPFSAPVIGDVTGDGVDEIVTYAGTLAGGHPGRLLVFDSRTLALSAAVPLVFPGSSDGPVDIKLRDIDGDGVKEIVMAADSGILIIRFNPSTGTYETVFSRIVGKTISRIDVADVDGDGIPELIFCTVSAGQATIRVNSLSHATAYDYFPQISPDLAARFATTRPGYADWESAPFPCDAAGLSSLAIGDVNRDGHPDAVIGDQVHGLSVIDLANHATLFHSDTIKATSIAVDPDGSFTAGTAAGTLVHFQSTTGTIQASDPWQVAPGPVLGLLAGFDGDMVTAAGGRVQYWPQILDFLPQADSLGWTSENRYMDPGHDSISRISTPALLWNGGGYEFFESYGYGLSAYEAPAMFDILPEVGIWATGSIAEGTSTTATLHFSRSGPTVTNLLLKFRLTGTAGPADVIITGADANTAGPIPYWYLTIPAGQSTATCTVTAIDDNVGEGPEKLIAALYSPVDQAPVCSIALPGIAIIPVADNDTVVGVTALLPEVRENPKSQTAGFVITRTGDTTKALKVNLATAGTATSGKDYRALPKTVTIPAHQASVTVPFTPTLDKLIEDDETVVLTVLAGTGYAADPGSPQASVIIHDVTSTAYDPQVSATATGMLVTFHRDSSDAACTVDFIESRVPETGRPTTSRRHVSFRAGADTATYSVRASRVPFTDTITIQPGTTYHLSGGAPVTFNVGG